jgi:hypothetical protein
MEFPNRRYQIFLKSGGGPIDVYLVSADPNPESAGPGDSVASRPAAAEDANRTASHGDSGMVKLEPLEDYMFSEKSGLADLYTEGFMSS